VLKDKTTQVVSFSEPSGLTMFTLKISGMAAGVRGKDYIMVNLQKKGSIYSNDDKFSNIANVDSKYESDDVFGVYHFRKDLILMFDNDCKVAIHKKKTETKYEFKAEVQFNKNPVFYPQYTKKAKVFINENDEVNILVAMTHPDGDDLKCIQGC
jgi:hypothetical protein